MEKLISSRLFGNKIKGSFMHRALVVIQLTCALTWNSSLYANPTDGNVVAGAANISQSGHVLKVDQSSNRAIINWGGFSIGAGEAVHFNQPGANSAVLNRVIGADPSAIMGSMQSNGQVFLINPNGIVFGAGARVDVGGIVASTLNISDSQFMAGSGTYDFKGNSKAGVYNYGEIRALQGDIYLIGAQVGNAGLLQAKNGNVGLAAGQDVRLVESSRPHLVVRATSESIGGTGVSNSGTIEALQAELVANGGNVYALAINNTGTIRATGSKTVGGRVYLTADGGDIATSGDIIAKQGTDGGYVEINTGGKDGTLASINGNIDVSGIEQGGAVFIRTANLNLVGSNINTSGAIPGMMTIVFGEDSILYEGPTSGDEVVSDPDGATTTTGTLSNPSGSYSNKTDLVDEVDVRLSASNNNLVVQASSTSDSVESGTGTTIVADGGGFLENVTLEVRPLGYNPGNAFANDTIYNAYDNIQFTVDGTNGQPVTVTVEGFKNDGTPYSFSITDNLGPGNDTFHFQDDGQGYVITKVSVNGAAAGMTQISQIKIDGETLIPRPGTIVVQKHSDGGDDTFNFTSTGGSNLPGAFFIETTDGFGQKTYADITAGAYSITEIVPDGWRLVSSSSSNGTPGGFNVGNGETVTVMFFNEKLGQIIVQKSIVSGGINNPSFDFNLSGTDTTNVDFGLAGSDLKESGTDLPYLTPGETYTVAELLGLNGRPESGGSELPNWDFTNVIVTKNGVEMDPSTLASQEFTVAAGDEFTFNFTNTERGQILISKSVAAGSDTNQAFSFTASGSPSTVNGFDLSQDDGTKTLQDTSGITPVDYLQPGFYTITELAKAGWFFDGIDPVLNAMITDNQAVVEVTPGGSVSLVFHNSEGGKITVNKTIVSGGINNPSFDFNLSGTDTTDVDFGLAGGGSKESGTDLPYLTPGETYTVAELLGLNGRPESGGSELPNWDFTNVIVTKNGVAMDPSTLASQEFTVTAGDEFSFNFTNTERGQILITKNVAAGSDTSTQFDFTASGELGTSPVATIPGLSQDDGTYTLQDTSGVSYLQPGFYTITELAKAGWFFDGIDPVLNAMITDNQAVVEVTPGGSVSLVFHNSEGGKITVNKTIVTTSQNNATFDFNLSGSDATDVDFGVAGGGSKESGADLPYLKPGETFTVAELLGLNGQPESGGMELGGWDFTNVIVTKNGVAMDPSTLASQEFTVAPGDEFSFNFTNTERGQIFVYKNVYSNKQESYDFEFDFDASGGPSTPGSFKLSDNGGQHTVQDSSGVSPVDYLKPGTYTIKELAAEGWFFDFVTGADDFYNPEATVTIEAGQTKTLRFYNTEGAQIMVTKNAFGPAGSTTNFDFIAERLIEEEGEGALQLLALTPGVDSFGPNNNSYPFMLKGGESTKLSEDPQVAYVRPGYYIVSELEKQGWFFDGITGADFVNGRSGEVYVGPGDVKNLTFFNSQAAQIMVTKNTIGPNGQNTPFQFFAEAVQGGQSVGSTSDSHFVLNGGQSIKLSSAEMAFYLRPGTYTVREGSTPGLWFFQSVTGADSVLGQTATVTVGNGEVANLVFTNAYQLPILTFKWDPIYPEGFGSGFPSYGSPDQRPEGELTGNSSAGVYQ